MVMPRNVDIIPASELGAYGKKEKRKKISGACKGGDMGSGFPYES